MLCITVVSATDTQNTINDTVQGAVTDISDESDNSVEEYSNVESNVIDKNTLSTNNELNSQTTTESTNETTTDNTTEESSEGVVVNDSQNVTIEKQNSTLKTSTSDKLNSTIVTDNIIYAKKGTTVNISAIIKANGYTVSSGQVAFKINGVTINTVNIKNDIASVSYDTSKLSYKMYDITIKYGGSTHISSTQKNIKLKILSDVSKYTYSQIVDAANRTQAFIESHQRLPNYVTVGSDKVLMQDLLYLFVKAQLTKSSVYNGNFTYAGNVETNCYNSKIYKNELETLTQRIVDSYEKTGSNPTSLTTSVGRVSFNDTIYIYSQLVTYVYTKNAYPNYATVLDLTKTNSIDTSSQSNMKQYVTIHLDSFKVYSTSTATVTAKYYYGDGSKVNNQNVVFKVNGITVGTSTVSNGVASLTFTVPNWAQKDYTLTTKMGASSNNYESQASSILSVTKNPNGTTIATKIILDDLYFAQQNKTGYLTAKILDNNGKAVDGGTFVFKINQKSLDAVTVSKGSVKVSFDSSALSTAKVHDIDAVYGGIGIYNVSRASSNLRVLPTLTTCSYSDVLELAKKTKTFIENNKRLPNYMTYNNVQITQANLLYLFAQVVSSNNSYANPMFSNTKTDVTTNCVGKNLTISQYTALANKIIDSFISEGKLSSSVQPSVGKISFDDLVYIYTRGAAYVADNGALAYYLMIFNTSLGTTHSSYFDGSSSSDSSSGGSSSGSSSGTVINTTGSIVDIFKANTKQISSSYYEYLASTKNCQVNNSVIVNAVLKAVNSGMSTYQQAVAIFNYVNKVTDYSYYLNTRSGAVKTLTQGYGNCVDMSHVLIAMYRTAGLPARYVHGANCVFRSGLVVGHVWAEVYVGGTWYKCDATSNYNSFNVIVNWNRCGAINRYISLPF